MTKNDFIMEHTEDYTQALQNATLQAKTCEYFTNNLVAGWRISAPYNKDKTIAEMSSAELYTVMQHIDEMIHDLERFNAYIETMATAKNELESVDLYEFD